jgi:hypothetical protein
VRVLFNSESLIPLIIKELIWNLSQKSSCNKRVGNVGYLISH